MHKKVNGKTRELTQEEIDEIGEFRARREAKKAEKRGILAEKRGKFNTAMDKMMGNLSEEEKNDIKEYLGWVE